MDLSNIKNRIPEHAKDLRLNLSSILTPEGAPGLGQEQIVATALACAIAARNETLLGEFEDIAREVLDESRLTAVRIASVINGLAVALESSLQLDAARKAA